jgi:phosphoesterase RecJ-like protein
MKRIRNLTQSEELLRAANAPLLTTHVGPDGDAVGSLLGLGWGLRSLNKVPILACEDPLPHRLDFLPGFGDVIEGPISTTFDLLVILDCSDPDRIGSVVPPEKRGTVPILNIDHHVTNLAFGQVNLVDTEATSTTHILYHLIQHLNVPIDERIATCLLTGLVTDTRGFRTANVTPEVLHIATELMEAGAPLTTITRNGLDRRPLAVLQLWGIGLDRLQIKDGLVWTSLPLEMQQAFNAEGVNATGLSSALVSAEEASVSAVFTELADGKIEVGFRAIPGYDVARVALALGGGGHALAAGCLVPGPLAAAEQRVIGMLREDLARQREEFTNDDRRHPQSQ